LIVTSPEFRKIGSDVILLTRDIFADAAVAVADGAKEAAEKSRPSESEKKKGVDFDKLQQKGKSTARHLATGKIQADARESIWDEVEHLQEYVDEKLPAGEEAKERFIERLQAVVKGAQEKPEYKRSITAIVGLFKKYAHKAEDALKETAEKSNISDEDEKVQQAGRDLKQFIEKVSNKSIDGVIKASQKVSHSLPLSDSSLTTGRRRRQEQREAQPLLQRPRVLRPPTPLPARLRRFPICCPKGIKLV
jgi:hypothetical protein